MVLHGVETSKSAGKENALDIKLNILQANSFNLNISIEVIILKNV